MFRTVRGVDLAYFVILYLH